jgi:regulator of replication initiation timing
VVILIGMFGFFLKKRVNGIEEEMKKSFNSVKSDIGSVGKWIKHLDEQNKQLFNEVSRLRSDLSTVHGEVGELVGQFDERFEEEREGGVYKKLPVLDKQLPVEDVQNSVQTAVQTGNFYDNLKGLSANERMLVLTLSGSDMKLSYEDLALLLGKERSTIRGQVNAIKQKSEGLIEELMERGGKKRIFVSEEIRGKLAKYAKTRMGGKGK